ncbi:MAG: hypothetical protein HY332_13785 [Chloroflexi bacterium]|nr:hypothetical protein [Chloroflexota bacterium]
MASTPNDRRPQIRQYERAGASEQLATSEALWRAVAAGEAPPTIRWYGYSAPAVVLGVAQQMAVLDEAACAAHGLEIVKRTSGGAAVLADRRMLALDVALPASHPLAIADVVEAYRWLGEVFLSALREVAANAVDLYPNRITLVSAAEARADQQAQRSAGRCTADGLRGLVCFGTLSRYEVARRRGGESGDGESAGLAKLVGLSQVRKRGVVFFQAGLYTDFDSSLLAGVLAVPAQTRPALEAELRRRVASLAACSLGEAHLPAVMDAFNRRAAAVFAAASRQGMQAHLPEA